MSLARYQIIPIDLNFGNFDKNSADKIQSKIISGVNPPCLMPIRVKKRCCTFPSQKNENYHVFPYSLTKYSNVPTSYLSLSENLFISLSKESYSSHVFSLEFPDYYYNGYWKL